MRSSDDDLPETGASARCLGVRLGVDIPSDERGWVAPGTEGMSVAPPPPENLVTHRRPPEFGGTGKDPVYELETDELPEELIHRPDPEVPERHGFIEPSRPMPFEEYRDRLQATRALWRRLHSNVR